MRFRHDDRRQEQCVLEPLWAAGGCRRSGHRCRFLQRVAVAFADNASGASNDGGSNGGSSRPVAPTAEPVAPRRRQPARPAPPRTATRAAGPLRWSPPVGESGPEISQAVDVPEVAPGEFRCRVRPASESVTHSCPSPRQASRHPLRPLCCGSSGQGEVGCGGSHRGTLPWSPPRPMLPAVAAPAAAVSGVVTGAESAGGGPLAALGGLLPTDSPLSWALMAFARRQPLVPRPPVVSLPLRSPHPDLRQPPSRPTPPWSGRQSDHPARTGRAARRADRAVNATSSQGLPMTYVVYRRPDAGGKIGGGTAAAADQLLRIRTGLLLPAVQHHADRFDEDRTVQDQRRWSCPRSTSSSSS